MQVDRLIVKQIMKKIYHIAIIALICFLSGIPAGAWDLNRLIGSGVKAISAATVSDEQIRDYVHQYVQKMDSENKIAPQNSEYTRRLNRLTSGLFNVDGVPLNFKVYMTDDINAFACADGSVRVYSGLMDVMTDDEVLGVIGHEIGHVAHKDTRKAMQHAILTDAFMEGLGSTNSTVAALTDSQLGQIGEAISGAKYSQKQESKADDYGYDFLKKNGKNPWAMALAFNKLKSLEGTSSNNGLKQMFSSHPTTEKRIEHIVKRCKKDKIAPPAGASVLYGK